MLSFQDRLGDKIPCPQCPPFNYLRSVLIRDCALLFRRFLNMIETPLLLGLYAADCICKFQDIQVGPRHGLLAALDGLFRQDCFTLPHWPNSTLSKSKSVT